MNPNSNSISIAPTIVERARLSSTATIHEASGQCGALPSAIRAVAPEMKLCGIAVTVDCPPGDNLWLHRALYTDLPPQAVVVATVRGAYEAGYWGEILAHAAMQRGVVGLVIDGCVRDATLLADLGFPVFARGLCVRGTTKSPASGGVNKPIVIGDVEIFAGDLVLGDADGVVTVRAERADEVVFQAEERDAKESAIIQRIHAGEPTPNIYGFRA